MITKLKPLNVIYLMSGCHQSMEDSHTAFGLQLVSESFLKDSQTHAIDIGKHLIATFV